MIRLEYYGDRDELMIRKDKAFSLDEMLYKHLIKAIDSFNEERKTNAVGTSFPRDYPDGGQS
jgi:hypothetical protein